MNIFYQIIIQPKEAIPELTTMILDNINIDELAHFDNDITVLENVAKDLDYDTSYVSKAIYFKLCNLIGEAIEMYDKEEEKTE